MSVRVINRKDWIAFNITWQYTINARKRTKYARFKLYRKFITGASNFKIAFSYTGKIKR